MLEVAGYLLYYRGLSAILVAKMPELLLNAAGKPTLNVISQHPLTEAEIGLCLDELKARYPLVV